MRRITLMMGIVMGAMVTLLAAAFSPLHAASVPLDASTTTSTFDQAAVLTAKGAVDGSNRGWAIEGSGDGPDFTLSQAAVFPTVSLLNGPVGPDGILIIVTLQQTDVLAINHVLGHFALSYTEVMNPDVGTPLSNFLPLELLDASGLSSGTTFNISVNEIIVGGVRLDQDTYVVTGIVRGVTTGITGFRLDVIDPNGVSLMEENRLPTGGPGRADNGNFVLSRIFVDAEPADLPSNLHCVGFDAPFDDGPVTGEGRLSISAELLDAVDSSVTDDGIAAAPVAQVLFNEVESNVLPIDVTGNSMGRRGGGLGNQFFYSDKKDKWIHGLLTNKFTAPGTYTITMVSGDDSEYVIEPTCKVLYIVE